MEDFTYIFEQASASVSSEYFHLPIDGGDPVYRERVYCYELYHQMRVRWPVDTLFCLNGEIDKAAHPILRDLGAGSAKPDFLVHQPGRMAGNYAVIEVKACGASTAAIETDIAKLQLFTNAVGYARGIYLIYGSEPDRTVARICAIRDYQPEVFAPIEVWVHASPGEIAFRV